MEKHYHTIISFHLFALLLLLQVTTPSFLQDIASVVVQPPQRLLLDILTTKSNYWAGGVATHINSILKQTRNGFSTSLLSSIWHILTTSLSNLRLFVTSPPWLESGPPHFDVRAGGGVWPENFWTSNHI